MEMKKFRKKPVIVDAYQITEEMLKPIVFDGNPYPKGLRLTSGSYNQETRKISHWFGEVITIHGQPTDVAIGDWIITEPDGEHFYPCKPDIFEATYEAV